MTKQGNRQAMGAARRFGFFAVCVLAFAAIAGSGQSADATTKAASAADDTSAAFHHSRGNGGIGGVVSIDNISASNFADFRRQMQMRLLSSLDNALSQKAEDALSQFSAVQKARAEFQSDLGGRKGNIGVQIIGAFSQAKRGGINYATGWQLRGYAGKDNAKGGNLGLFYRGATDNSLWGVNAFVDYEDNDYGGFARYSIGGEWQNALFSFGANYYLPAGGDRRQDNVVAFSRRGYDAQLRMNLSQSDFIKAAMDYYHFDGKHGTEADEGLRYGIQAHLAPYLRVGLFYDDGDNDGGFGGDVAVSYTIGEDKARRNAETFAPDLFAAVSREYSQRIATATVSAGPAVAFNTTVSVSTNVSVLVIVNTVEMMEVVSMSVSLSVTASRVASVQFTMRVQDFGNLLLSTRHDHRVTLPPADTARPWMLTVMWDITEVINFPFAIGPLVIDAANTAWIGRTVRFGDTNSLVGVRTWTLTIVEGSEQIAEPTTTTLTNTTTTTVDASTTTMTTTVTSTVSTTITLGTITLGANSAIPPDGGGKSPFIPPPKLPQLPQMAMADAPILRYQTPRPPPKTGTEIKKPQRGDLFTARGNAP